MPAKRLVACCTISALTFAVPVIAVDYKPIPSGTPDAFMAAFYGKFKNHGLPEINDQTWGFYLTPELAALARKHDQQIQNGQVEDAMGEDGVDFCLCQDTGHPVWTTHIDVVAGDAAKATGVFKDGSTTVVTKFELAKTPAGWRIADYHDAKGKGSYASGLRAQVAHDAKIKPHTYD